MELIIRQGSVYKTLIDYYIRVDNKEDVKMVLHKIFYTLSITDQKFFEIISDKNMLNVWPI